MKKMTSKQADLVLIAVTMLWGSGFVVAKEAVTLIPPIEFLVVRFSIASVLSIVFFRKKIFTFAVEEWKGGAIIGMLLAAIYILQTIGLQYTSVGKTAFISGSSVVLVPFLSWAIQKKKPSVRNGIAILILLPGLYILTMYPSVLEIGLGDVLVILSSICFALQIVLLNHYCAKGDSTVVASVQFFVCALICFAGMLVTPMVPIPGMFIPKLLYVGVLVTFLTFVLQAVVQKYTSAIHSGIIVSLEAVFGVAFAVAFLGETYTFSSIVSLTMIFVSIMVTVTDTGKVRKRDESENETSH